MSNQIEMYYSTFGGVDTRSSKLLQNPKTFRRGTKNFRYDFQDQTINRQGFQRKDSGAPNFVDIFEYKYRDVNTGAAATQILGVATDGHLYRQRTHSLKFNTHTGYTSVSVYFDDVANTFKIVLNGATPVTVNISDSMTLKDNPTTTASLVGALNAIPGASASIVDDAGATVSASTQLAYLLDCVINDSTFADNAVYYWTRIPHPEMSCVSVSSVTEATLDFSNSSQWTMDAVPFKTTLKAQSNAAVAASYEGISTINLNNSIYITDGGFPMKYDGKCVYRAGMPKQIQSVFFGVPTITGMTYTAVSTPVGLTALPAGTYAYKARFGFTDASGFTTFGDIIPIPTTVSPPPVAASNVVKIDTKGIYYGQDFPSFCAKINGEQATGSGGAGVTLTVTTGHNILPGMVVRQVTTSGPLGFAYRSTQKTFINFYAKVTAVTATTITLAETVDTAGDGAYTSRFNNGDILQAYYIDPIYENQRPSSQAYNPPGLFIEVYRTKVDALTGPYYLLTKMPVPHKQGDTVTYYDQRPSSELTENFVDQDPGAELPRACKYLTGWQNQLVQAGYPADPTLKDSRYPSVSDPNTATFYSQPAFDLYTYYTESFLCDFQSIYHSDFTTPEGFPQDGEHEFAIDTPYADRVTGIAQNKDALFALKERSTAVLTGSVAENDIVMEVLESDAGCSSHKSIQDVRGHLVWLDGINGFYSCVAGRLPENIGFPIQDYQKINELKLDYSKAAACNFRKESLYICSVEGTTFVFDYADNGTLKRACWYIWDGFTGKSLLATSDNKFLLWDGTYTQKMKLTLTDYDHSDHKTAIPMVLNTAWLTQGRPTIDKHYVGFWINSIQGDFTLTVKQYGNFLEDLIGTQTNVYFLPETSQKKFIKAQVKAALPKLSAISFGMEHSEINKAVKIQGYELQYSADFAAGEPKR